MLFGSLLDRPQRAHLLQGGRQTTLDLVKVLGKAARNQILDESVHRPSFQPSDSAKRRHCPIVEAERERLAEIVRHYFPDCKKAREEGDDNLADRILAATPKTLRHSYASLATAAGIPAVFAAADMGHTLEVHRTTYVRPIRRYEGIPNTGRAGMAALALAARKRAYDRWNVAQRIPTPLATALERVGRLV